MEINLDRDTEDKSGSPAIANTIFQKIRLCDIFIGDITIINKTFLNQLIKGRLSPNPNVLIELGYAINILGWDRVICITDTNVASVEEMPFDNRVYRVTMLNSRKDAVKQHLTKTLTNAIESIVVNFDKILEAQSKERNELHDLNIFKRLSEICSESLLHESTSVVVDSLSRDQVFRLFHTKLEAVYEEKNRGLDNDGRKVYETMLTALFPTHHYGTQTTIGKKKIKFYTA